MAVGSKQMAENRKQTAESSWQKMAALTIGLFLLLLLVRSGLAQNISFNASVDRTEVSVGEQITLTVSVSGDVKSIPQPELPSLDEFNVYSAGRSQNFTYVNGRLSASVTFNYVLVPRKAGKLTIGPASIKLDGKTYQTTPIQITVASEGKTPSSPAPSKEEKSTTKPQLSGKDIFMETVVDKRKAYVNEQIVLTLRFYQGIRLFDNAHYTLPPLIGFWAEDLPPKKQYHKTVNGKQYLVHEIKTALFPTSTGKVTIGPAELKCVVEDADRFFRDPFSVFDRNLSNLLRQGKPQILKSKPIQIEVLSPPE
ncbi:MAG: BatD family protein, partial [Candidatus Zixiibacteriota bacterium]